jgi:Uma2 family endonuclease
MSVVSLPERARISADRYQKMVETGVLTQYDRVELVDGDMLNMAPIGLSHSAVTDRLTKQLVLSAGDSAIVSSARSLKLGEYSVPQPDLMLLKSREDFYAAQIPLAPDVLLLIEVSDSSLVYDQGIKRALYAGHGVAEYWVVDVMSQRVYVYREPTGDGYAQALEHAADDIVTPQALPCFQVAARRFFT